MFGRLTKFGAVVAALAALAVGGSAIASAAHKGGTPAPAPPTQPAVDPAGANNKADSATDPADSATDPAGANDQADGAADPAGANDSADSASDPADGPGGHADTSDQADTQQEGSN